MKYSSLLSHNTSKPFGPRSASNFVTKTAINSDPPANTAATELRAKIKKKNKRRRSTTELRARVFRVHFLKFKFKIKRNRCTFTRTRAHWKFIISDPTTTDRNEVDENRFKSFETRDFKIVFFIDKT